MNAIIKQVAAMTLLGVAALIHSHDAAAALPTPECTKLYAGKSAEAGTVCVTNDLESLYVTYSTTGDWYLDDVHLFVGATLATMPVTKTGNPKIGNFPYVVENLNTQMYTFTVPLGDFGAADPCVSPKKIAIAAHAALIRRDTAGVIYQTETGWANGTQLNIKGSWAMYFEYTTRCPPQNSPVTYSCETAFAFGDQTFADLGNIRNARWGWQITVDQGTSGDMTPIYAGAAQNDPSKGSYVGYLTYSYDGATLSLSYTMLDGWVLQATHVYAGDTYTNTTAPGQYGNLHEGLRNVTSDTYQISVTGDPIFVIAHAEACHAVSN